MRPARGGRPALPLTVLFIFGRGLRDQRQRAAWVDAFIFRRLRQRLFRDEHDFTGGL
jgi:hypothetical protein